LLLGISPDKQIDLWSFLQSFTHPLLQIFMQEVHSVIVTAFLWTWAVIVSPIKWVWVSWSPPTIAWFLQGTIYKSCLTHKRTGPWSRRLLGASIAVIFAQSWVKPFVGNTT
jgi:hypothetical protein